MRPLESFGNSVSTSFKPTTAIAGIGGWLLLLIVRLWIGTAVRLIGGFAAGFSLLGLFSFGSVALSGAAALLLGFKNAKGVLIAKIFLAADAIYYSLALIDFLLGSDSQVSSSMPPWFQPSGYLIASVLWLVYLIRSRRVKNTYFPAVMQVDTEDEQVPSGRHGWAEMAEPSTAERATGFVVGGISPIGQRRRLPTLVDESATRWATIFVSGGRRGLELELAAADLVALTNGRLAPIGRS